MPRQLQHHERIKRVPLGSQLMSTGGTKTWKISFLFIILRINGGINSSVLRKEGLSKLATDKIRICFVFFNQHRLG